MRPLPTCTRPAACCSLGEAATSWGPQLGRSRRYDLLEKCLIAPTARQRYFTQLLLALISLNDNLCGQKRKQNRFNKNKVSNCFRSLSTKLLWSLLTHW